MACFDDEDPLDWDHQLELSQETVFSEEYEHGLAMSQELSPDDRFPFDMVPECHSSGLSVSASCSPAQLSTSPSKASPMPPSKRRRLWKKQAVDQAIHGTV